MKLDVPLLKLPRQYCPETLAAEVMSLPRSMHGSHIRASLQEMTRFR